MNCIGRTSIKFLGRVGWLLGCLLSITVFQCVGQSVVNGLVKDARSGEPLSFATVIVIGTNDGAVTDNNGRFTLTISNSTNARLVATYVGYLPDTTSVTSTKSFYVFQLQPGASLKEVVITGTMRETSKLDSPIPIEVYTPQFFKKNPSPNIFESLGMVNGVQPQLNCNVCNTGDIHLNGMEGPYTMVLIDGMPIVSSLATVYGFAGIPNSMVKRIEVVKGPASTLYGSEAVGGLINIITQDPADAPRFRFDMSGTTLHEYNADVSTKVKTKFGNGLVGLNGFWYNTPFDINRDGFTDFTLQRRASIFNKWDINRKSNKQASLAARYFLETRWGGELHWSPEYAGTDSVYGETITTNRFELIGAYALPVKEAVRFEYSYNYHLQDSYYGTIKYYADQHVAFGQFLWDRSIGKHNLLIGTPFRFTYYDDNSPATASFDTLDHSNKPSLTYLPGVFIQDEWKRNDKFTTLAGLRYDYNSQHGHIVSPRLSFKFSPNKLNTVRLSMGNGYRVVNLFTEDHAALTGARYVTIREELKPEQSWNANLNHTAHINLKKSFIGFDWSLFYTYFTNKITGDFMTDPQQIIYDNLSGYAVSKGATVNTDVSFTNGLKVNAGITLMDVYEADRDSTSALIKTPQLFAPKFSGTYAVSFTFHKSGTTIDWTGRVNGPMHLPVVPNDFRPAMSPWFCIMNLQLTQRFRRNVEVYIGAKNLLNFIPTNPILRPFDPFDRNIHVDNPHGYTFDPSYNYAPMQGVKGFAGVRWTYK